MNAYECLPIDEVTPVQYVGVYVMHWQPEWGEPEVAFRESEAAEELLAAANDTLEAIEKDPALQEQLVIAWFDEDSAPPLARAMRRLGAAVSAIEEWRCLAEGAGP